MARSGGVYAGVMDLMLASSRNMPDFDAAARSFEAVGDERLAELEPAARRTCPHAHAWRPSSAPRPPRWPDAPRRAVNGRLSREA